MSPSSERIRREGTSGRFYLIDGVKFPSVTTILSVINKPALVSWSAKVEREACTLAATELYAELAPRPQLPRAMYVLALEQRLGQTKAHTKALAAAAEIGTACHSKIEWLLRRQLGQRVGPEPMGPDAVEWSVMAFEDWSKAVQIHPLAIETTVFSRTHAYAGTLDLLAELNGPALLTVLERQGPVAVTLGDWLRRHDTVTACIDFKTGKQVWPESFIQATAYVRALAEMGHGRVDGALIVRLPKLTTDPAFEVCVVPPARDLFPVFLAARQLWQWQFDEEQAYRAKRVAVA